MASKTQAPTSAGGMLALIVALVVGAGFLWGFVKQRPYDDRSEVTFIVTFEPADRVVPVDIVIYGEGGDIAPLVAEKTRKSPWSVTLKIARGQTFKLVAVQEVRALLACSVNGEVQETTDRPGPVVCLHKRGS